MKHPALKNRLNYPPLVKGGQGRSARDISESSSALLWFVLLAAVLVALLAWAERSTR